MNHLEKQKIKEHLDQVAKILYENTQIEQLNDFENVELAVRKHIIETVAPTIGNFFLIKQEERQ